MSTTLLGVRKSHIYTLGTLLFLFTLLWLGIAHNAPQTATAATAMRSRDGYLGQTIPPTQVVTVTATGSNQFISATVEITAGDTIVWKRVAGVHSVTADDGSFNQPLSSAWDTFSRKFDIPGDYLYYCTLHGGPNNIGMAGKVIVRARPEETSVMYLPWLEKR